MTEVSLPSAQTRDITIICKVRETDIPPEEGSGTENPSMEIVISMDEIADSFADIRRAKLPPRLPGRRTPPAHAGPAGPFPPF